MATRSAGKLRELLPWFAVAGVSVESLEDAGLPESADEAALEVFDTFEANALAKARWFHAQTGGRVVVADDSGLEVVALDDAPGVRSKRWSGRIDLEGAVLDLANNAQLLKALDLAEAAGRTSRRARYVCAAACVWPGGELVVRGTTEGEITRTPSGGGGFGYDPYFRSDDLATTFAAVSKEQKGAVSHRGRAFATLVEELGRRGVLPGFPVSGDADG